MQHSSCNFVSKLYTLLLISFVTNSAQQIALSLFQFQLIPYSKSSQWDIHFLDLSQNDARDETILLRCRRCATFGQISFKNGMNDETNVAICSRSHPISAMTKVFPPELVNSYRRFDLLRAPIAEALPNNRIYLKQVPYCEFEFFNKETCACTRSRCCMQQSLHVHSKNVLTCSRRWRWICELLWPLSQ